MSKKKQLTEAQEQLMAVGEDFGKGFSLFGLAIKNVRTYAWMNLKVCFTFAALAFLLCLFTVYNVALNDYRDNLVYGSISANYFYTQYEKTVNSFKEEYPEVTVESEDSYLQYSYEKDVRDIYGWGGTVTPTTAYFTFEADGVKYNAKKALTMQTDAADDGFFNRFDYLELKYKFSLTSPWLVGGAPKEADEFAIAQPLLEAYGLTAEDVMGKTVSVYMKDTREGHDPLLFEFSGRVCGVIRSEYFQTAGHNASDETYPMLLFPTSAPHFSVKGRTLTRYRLFFKEWPEEEVAYLWQTEFVGCYRGYSNVSGLRHLDSVQTLASNLYIIIGSSLVVGLILTVFLMIDKYMKVFSRSGGILLTFGMRRSQLYALLFLQLLILCALAIPLSFVLTAAGYTVINLIVSWGTHINLVLSTGKIVIMLLLGIAVVFAIALAFFGYAVFKLRNRTIKEFLGAIVD